MQFKIAVFLLISASSLTSLAQAPTAGFSLPPNACVNEYLDIVNSSINVVNHEWDFCEGDMRQTPAETFVATIDGSADPLALRIVLDGSDYFGFICSGGNGKVIRAKFGSSLLSEPTFDAIDPLISTPTGIDIFHHNNQWYGVVGNFFSPGELKLLQFGTSLNSTPTVVTIGPTVAINSPRSLRVAQENGSLFLFIAMETGFLTRISLDPALDGSVIASESIVIDLSARLHGLDIVETQGAKFILISDYELGKIEKVSFGNSWANPPTSVVQTLSIAVTQPTTLQLVPEDGAVFCLLTTEGGTIYTLEYAADMSGNAPSMVQLPLSQTGPNLRGLSVARASGKFHAFYTRYGARSLDRLDFSKPCDFTQLTVTSEASPYGQKYLQPGTYNIGLRVDDGNGKSDFAFEQVTVSNLESPAIDIVSTGNCTAAPVAFATPGYSTGTFDWDFGDGHMSSSVAPGNLYAAPGVYNVTLRVTAVNTCNNYLRSDVTVYAPPVAGFDSPTGLLCTNNEFFFENTTLDNFNGLLSYDWKVNAQSVSSTRDLTYIFENPGAQEISLTTSIPGCSDDQTINLGTVETGPIVDFTATGQCEGAPIQFDNASAGSISSYNWDFGNGDVSAVEDPTVVYDDPGTYDVTLEVLGTNGCLTLHEEAVVVYSTPVPNFSLDLPPFSCSGSGSQFHDLTPNPNDSNLQTWLWSFDDGSTGSGKNPIHTYSQARQYTVNLTVTTDKTCVKSLSKVVTISPAPGVDFANNPACVNQQTLLAGSSTGTIKSWQWKIGQAIYQQQNTTHIFAAPGSFPVQLSATATNNCISTVSKSIVVPIIPPMDIEVVNGCAGQSTTLLAKVGASDDVSTGYSWNFGGGVTGTGQEITRTYSQVGNYPVVLQVSMASGCRYSRGEVVTINAVPSVAFVPAETYGAAPLEVRFTNNTTGAATYLWHFAGSADLTSNVASPTYTYTQLGTYAVTLEATSAAGCIGSSSGSVHVIVPYTDLSIEEFSLLSDPASGASKGVLRLKNNSNHPATPVSFIIDLGAGVLLNETLATAIGPQAEVTLTTASSLTFQRAGSGYICVTASIDKDEVPNNNRQCLSLTGSSELFEPYPNPTDGILSLQVISPVAETVSIRIVSGNGADAYSKEIDTKAGLNVFELDLSMLTAGLYVVQVFSSTSQILTRRISIQY